MLLAGFNVRGAEFRATKPIALTVKDVKKSDYEKASIGGSSKESTRMMKENMIRKP